MDNRNYLYLDKRIWAKDKFLTAFKSDGGHM